MFTRTDRLVCSRTQSGHDILFGGTVKLFASDYTIEGDAYSLASREPLRREHSSLGKTTHKEGNTIMKSLTSLLIGCSLALAGAALAQQPVEQQSPSKGKRAPEKARATQAQPGPNAAKPETP